MAPVLDPKMVPHVQLPQGHQECSTSMQQFTGWSYSDSSWSWLFRGFVLSLGRRWTINLQEKVPQYQDTLRCWAIDSREFYYKIIFRWCSFFEDKSNRLPYFVRALLVGCLSDPQLTWIGLSLLFWDVSPAKRISLQKINSYCFWWCPQLFVSSNVLANLCCHNCDKKLFLATISIGSFINMLPKWLP